MNKIKKILSKFWYFLDLVCGAVVLIYGICLALRPTPEFCLSQDLCGVNLTDELIPWTLICVGSAVVLSWWYFKIIRRDIQGDEEIKSRVKPEDFVK